MMAFGLQAIAHPISVMVDVLPCVGPCLGDLAGGDESQHYYYLPYCRMYDLPYYRTTVPAIIRIRIDQGYY